ncbi:MAG: hypothetical protein AAB817_03175 [Patescibacteria group bacterium]
MPHRFTDELAATQAAPAAPLPLFSNHRRVTTAAVGIGVIVLALGVWQMSRNVTQPFRPSPDALKVDFSYLDAEKNTVEKSKQTDTDGDGLSDYDEQQVYQTSIYLADTDSDGISDKDEIIKGKDPRCPEGQTCENFNYYGPAPSATTDAAALEWLQTSQTSGTVSVADLQQTLLSMDTTELRQLLVDNGVPADQVNQLTDEQVVALFYQALQEQTAAATVTTPAATPTNAVTPEPDPGTPLTAAQKAEFVKEITAMTGDQVRQTLITSGIDAKLLTGKDDATLRQFLLQTLELGN